MSRLMSVAMTADAVIERRKTVTRRKGWWLDKNGRRLLNVGDTLTLCRKVQGRKPGEPIERLAEVEVVDARRERLNSLGKCICHGMSAGTYSGMEMVREGFPGMDPDEFVRRYFMDAQGMARDEEVTRIEWRYLDEPCNECNRTTHEDDAAPSCGSHRVCVPCYETSDFRCRECRRVWTEVDL